MVFGKTQRFGVKKKQGGSVKPRGAHDLRKIRACETQGGLKPRLHKTAAVAVKQTAVYKQKLWIAYAAPR